MSSLDINSLEQISAKLRGRIVEFAERTKTPHLGSCLSCIDVLTVLYFYHLNIPLGLPNYHERDKFILSKGHAAPALFQVLALRGFFSFERLLLASHDGHDVFGEHPPAPKDLLGIEAATGSLGHGLPMGVGMAIAAKILNEALKIIILLGDGECNEGSNWEAAMQAQSMGLSNLTIVIDHNKWQATSRTSDTLSTISLAEKWQSFGWDVTEINGNSIKDLVSALSNNPENSPRAIIANTVKGKGVSFMEDDNNWHYRTPTKTETDQALSELGLSREKLFK